MILRFFPNFPLTFGEVSGSHLTAGPKVVNDCFSASDESTPLRGIGPKDRAVNNYSQTTAESLRCILMSSDKRHQQATVLDGSGLRLGHPYPPSATRRAGM